MLNAQSDSFLLRCCEITQAVQRHNFFYTKTKFNLTSGVQDLTLDICIGRVEGSKGWTKNLYVIIVDRIPNQLGLDTQYLKGLEG